jgi:hypothetical protein
MRLLLIEIANYFEVPVLLQDVVLPVEALPSPPPHPPGVKAVITTHFKPGLIPVPGVLHCCVTASPF